MRDWILGGDIKGHLIAYFLDYRSECLSLYHLWWDGYQYYMRQLLVWLKNDLWCKICASTHQVSGRPMLYTDDRAGHAKGLHFATTNENGQLEMKFCSDPAPR